MSESPITNEMLEHYWEHGYTMVRGLFSPELTESYRAHFEDIVSGEVEPSEGMLVMRDIMVAKGAVETKTRAEEIAKVQDFENDELLYSYVTHTALLDCVERFVGHDVFTLHTMLINKPPNVDGRHPLHQDLLYFPFRPADKIVAGWTALERITVQNGCLTVVPGSHKHGLLKHENPDWEYLNGGYFGAEGAGENSERVYLEMEPGDTVFFHPILLHGSGRNKTQGFRRAISAHFASTNCQWEWTIDEVNRKYKIVRGEHAGECWQSSDASSGKRDNTINPMDYLPSGLRRPGNRPPSEQN
jgi:phytanoyl-CoA hydroxylase